VISFWSITARAAAIGPSQALNVVTMYTVSQKNLCKQFEREILRSINWQFI